ncbi:MAG: AAA family ATPase [Candidatus Methylomirabilales bacterium]
MYERFFGLKEKPFSLTPDPRFLFLSPNHRGALDHLLYGIGRREGFLAITGDIGTGKTTICRALLEHLDAQVQTALILNPMLEEEELLTAILQDFGITPPPRATRKELVDRLNRFLLEQARKGGGAVLIIDEAQNLPPKVLEQIRILSNLETEKEKLLQIVLVGQRELREKLESPSLRQLNQRISIRYHLIPLGQEEMVRYIEHRLTVAGGSGGIEFTPAAYQAIYRFSRGVPRLINLAADRALLSGYVAGSTRIMKKMVQDGQRSLTGEVTTVAPHLRPARAQHLKAALLTLCLSLLFGALFAGLLQRGSVGLEGWWSAIGERLSPRSATSRHPTSGEVEPSAPPPIAVPVFHPDAAFPYTIGALTSQGGEVLRKIVETLQQEGLEVFLREESGESGIWHRVLVGRFKTPEDAQAVVEKVQRVEGLERVEIIQSPPPTTPQEG